MRAFVLALLLHAAALALLVVNLQLGPKPIQPVASPVNIVNAVAVEQKQVDAEIDRLKEIDRKKQKDIEDKLKALQQKADKVEQERKQEEKRLAEAKKQKEQEQQRIADLKAQQEAADKKRQQEEAERKRKAEEERQKQIAAQKKKEEEDRKKKEAEARARELAEEQRALEAAQAKQDQGVVNQYAARIKQAIEREFNTTGLPDGLSCVLQIRMIPGGEVVEAHVIQTSGDPIFDRRAELAVQKAAPLPVPDDPRQFEIMRVTNLTFAPTSGQN